MLQDYLICAKVLDKYAIHIQHILYDSIVKHLIKILGYLIHKNIIYLN